MNERLNRRWLRKRRNTQFCFGPAGFPNAPCHKEIEIQKEYLPLTKPLINSNYSEALYNPRVCNITVLYGLAQNISRASFLAGIVPFNMFIF